ncbi:MAG: ATP-binding cassette domain-containing protein [Candidatus Latescibacteria bacterium]|nr:ATP-binding cassette domain-containing protein [Candidatus Latescibacterota bacterium]
MVKVENLTKYYGLKQALDKISFTVNKGEVMGFLGPNGAGKSTAMKIITGFLSPTEGAVKVDGLDVVEDSLEVRKRIGYLPEHPPLYLEMTVKSYLEFNAQIKGVERKKVKDSVDRVIETCGLEKYYKIHCRALSKGYRQRVGIAQAMIHDPMVLILDEPTIGLDPIQIVEIRELIKTFGGEHTVILSTHILPEVDMTCEKVIIINDGKIVVQDSTANLRARIPNADHLFVEVRGDATQLQSKIENINGVSSISEVKKNLDTTTYTIVSEDSVDIRPEIARTVINENLELLELKNTSMTLEEVFINVTMT